MERVDNEIKKIISQHLGVGEREITDSSDLKEDLNASPLEIADLITKLEEVFRLKIPEDEVQKFSTVGDIITFLSDNIHEIERF